MKKLSILLTLWSASAFAHAIQPITCFENHYGRIVPFLEVAATRHGESLRAEFYARGIDATFLQTLADAGSTKPAEIEAVVLEFKHDLCRVSDQDPLLLSCEAYIIFGHPPIENYVKYSLRLKSGAVTELGETTGDLKTYRVSVVGAEEKSTTRRVNFSLSPVLHTAIAAEAGGRLLECENKPLSEISSR